MLRKYGQTADTAVFFWRWPKALLRVSAECLADLLGCSQRILSNAIDQPRLHRMLCVNFFGCYEHVKSLRFSDETRQSLSPAPACN